MSQPTQACSTEHGDLNIPRHIDRFVKVKRGRVHMSHCTTLLLYGVKLSKPDEKYQVEVQIW